MKTVEKGRYLARIAGCNDCHTAGYLMSEGKVPVDQWLRGDNFGWSGPWGTTYGTNLRLLINELTEKGWIEFATTLKVLPPMPWFNLNIMTHEDLKSIYQFIRYLGPNGKPAILASIFMHCIPFHSIQSYHVVTFSFLTWVILYLTYF